MLKAWSGHIIFEKGFQFKQLADIYPELYARFLKETNQMNREEPDADITILRSNLIDLEKNRKPEGYNRMGKIRMIFPLTSQPQLYIYKQQSRSAEVVRVTEAISDFLNEHGIKNRIEWDKMFYYKLKKRK
jgi:hypothetical protein